MKSQLCQQFCMNGQPTQPRQPSIFIVSIYGFNLMHMYLTYYSCCEGFIYLFLGVHG